MDLSYYGFVNVGKWKLNENSKNSKYKKRKSGIDFELNNFEGERVIYAFVVDGNTKYIGICEEYKTTLKKRMGNYKKLQGGSTNERIADEIKECLTKGKTVEIFALKPESVSGIQYKGLEIDLVRGLEYPLIRKLNPEWNKAGRTR